MHGIMLHHNGYAVTILEQDTASRREGFDAGIRVGPDFVSLLKKYDRIDRPYEIHATGYQFINAAGGLGRRIKQEMPLSSWGLLVSILRANFDGTPSKAVPHVLDREDHLKKAEFRPGACVKSVEDMGKTIKVRFEDVLRHTTESISADLVIVADGSNSSIRKQLIPGVSRQYAGYVSWRGTVRESLLEECYRKVFQGNAIFHLMDRSYILV
jgi:2-polyprenyl-6-methoxyphenol hydroxylase-like FAD-dependent oxidoreductase